MPSSTATTRGVTVQVESAYSEAHSEPAEGAWFFLYTIRITNEGEEPVQLISRHWIITDGTGAEREVRGPGVVGKQPLLSPGESFEYTSGCPLETTVGSMRGSYQMVTAEGKQFEAEVAPFTLSLPFALN